jgi:flagellar motor protein MotB
VRLAIAILKDRNGQILLDVPIEGSLDDPQFRIGKVVTRTLLNILEKAATSPFSLLGAVFGGGGEELSYQDFAPGSAVLLPANEQKLDSLVKGLYERPGLQLEIVGSIDPEADRDSLRRASLDKQIRTRQWTSLRKSERATTTPGQLTLTPEERAAWVKTLYSEALDKGVINAAFIAANTNLAAIAAQIPSRSGNTEKSATRLMERSSATVPTSSKAATVAHQPKPVAPADPMEALLMAAVPVTDGDFEALASERAKAVRAYILQTGKVEAERLFLTENQTGGVRSDGSRVYLQFR